MARLGLSCHDCDDILKTENGCEGKSLRAWYINDVRYDRCPLKLVDDASWELLTAYGLFKAGHLPHGSGWLDESERFNSAMLFIQAQIGKKKDG